MKKLLHIVNSIDPKLGGVSEAIRNYNIGINSDLNNVLNRTDIVCFDSIEDCNKWFPEASNIYGLGKAHLPWKYNSYFSTWIDEHLINYDIVIVHGLWLYHSYATVKKLNAYKVNNAEGYPKVYIMPHGMLDPWFQHDKSRKLKSLRNLVYWHFIEKYVISDSDGLLFTCFEEQRLAKTTFKDYKPRKEIILGLGIEEPVYLRNLMNSAKDSKPPYEYILFLGRIDYKKGIDILIEAFENFLQKYPDSTLRLHVVGPGLESVFGQKIENYVKSSNILKDKILFLGMQLGENKWSTFYNAKAFILPSHQENFGISVVEALACSTPVLISDKVNIHYEISKYKAGLVESDTLEGTYNLLEKFSNLSDTEYKEMKNNSRIAFEENFNINRVVNNFQYLL